MAEKPNGAELLAIAAIIVLIQKTDNLTGIKGLYFISHRLKVMPLDINYPLLGRLTVLTNVSAASSAVR